MNENGVISFGNPWNNPYPETFPTSNFYSRNGLAVAPFWSDNDIRRAGAVRYITYSSFDSDSLEGRSLMDEVNAYIRTQTQQRGGGQRFDGNWLLAVHWDHVHPSPHGASDTENVGIASNLEMVR